MNQRHEAYGSVDINTTGTSLSRRRKLKVTRTSSTGRRPTSKFNSQNQTKLYEEQDDVTKQKKQKNVLHQLKFKFIGIITLSLISIFILPSPFLTQQIQQQGSSSFLLSSQYFITTFTTIYCLLLLYILDLCNWKNGFYNMIWVSFAFVIFAFSWECHCGYRMDNGGRNHVWNNWNNMNLNDEDGIQNLVLWRKSELWSYFILNLILWMSKIMFFFSMVRRKSKIILILLS